MNPIRRGMKQRDALRALGKVGFTFRERIGTGEIFLLPPQGGKPIVLRRGRKDIPSEVVHLVERSLKGGYS